MSLPDFSPTERPPGPGQQGNLEEFPGGCDRAVRITSDDGIALNKKAAALISLNRFEEALVPAKKAAEVNPGSADAWITIGVALDKLERPLEASEALERAVSVDPYNAYALALLGIIYQKLDMGERADAQNRKLQEIVFPRVYAGIYFAIAAFLLGALLGGIRGAEGKPPDVIIISQIVILLLFCGICVLYWRSMTMGNKGGRHLPPSPYPSSMYPHPGTRGTYMVLFLITGVFVAGIILGINAWNYL